MKGLNETFQFQWASYVGMNIEKTVSPILTRSKAAVRMKYIMEYFVLYIFLAVDGLKKSYQLLIGLNEIHTVIPDIHVLQV